MQTRPLLIALIILIVGCILVSSSNYNQDYLYHQAIGNERNTEHNLLNRTTERIINYYDRKTRTIQNTAKEGLFSTGPSIHLQKGRYQLYLEFTPLFIDKSKGEMAYDVYKANRDNSTTMLATRTVDIKKFSKNPRIDFETPGGVGHEIALYVSSSKSRLAMRSIRIKPLSLSYGPYIIHALLAVAFLLFLVFGIKKLSQTTLPIESERLRAAILFLGVFSVYLLIILQPFWPVKEISLTGDAPHFVVLAHYFAKYKTLAIESIDKVYDYSSYGPLIGFRLFDPPTHMHEMGDYLYPHHQYGFSFILAILFIAGFHGVVYAMIFSALMISTGVVYVYKILTHTPNCKNAFLLAALAALSPPLLFYSFAIYTEVLAFPIIAAASYYLFLDRRSEWKQYLSIALLGLLLFFKVKYCLLAVPLLFCGLWGNGSMRSRLAKASLFLAFTVLYLVHVRLATGSFHPFAWYQAVSAGGSGGISKRLMLLPVMSLGFLMDQRYGMFLIAPFTILLLFGLKRYYKAAVEEKGAVLKIFILIVVYMGFYAASGSFGGACPFLRPHVTIWALIVFLVFSVEMDLERIWVRVPLALSILFSVLMLGTGFFMTSYTENYSKFFQSITPYRIKLYKHLPNTTMTQKRIFRSISGRPKPSKDNTHDKDG